MKRIRYTGDRRGSFTVHDTLWGNNPHDREHAVRDEEAAFLLGLKDFELVIDPNDPRVEQAGKNRLYRWGVGYPAADIMIYADSGTAIGAIERFAAEKRTGWLDIKIQSVHTAAWLVSNDFAQDRAFGEMELFQAPQGTVLKIVAHQKDFAPASDALRRVADDLQKFLFELGVLEPSTAMRPLRTANRIDSAQNSPRENRSMPEGSPEQERGNQLVQKTGAGEHVRETSHLSDEGTGGSSSEARILLFNGEFTNYPEELFRIAFEVAESIESPNASSGRGGVDVPPEALRGIHTTTRIRILEAKMRVNEHEDGQSGLSTDDDLVVGYVSIQPKSDAGSRITIEQLDEPKATRRPLAQDSGSPTFVKEQLALDESAACIHIVSAVGFDRAAWFEHFTYLFLLQADSVQNADAWLRARGQAYNLTQKAHYENNHLRLSDGYTLAHYLADRQKAIVRQRVRTIERGEQATTVFVGRCQYPEKLVASVEAFVRKQLPLHLEGREPMLHSGYVRPTDASAATTHDIRATLRGVGEASIGRLDMTPANDTDYDFELIRHGNWLPEWSGFEFKTLSDLFDALAERLRQNYPRVEDAQSSAENALVRRAPIFFITHASEDKGFARKLYDALRAHGLEGFLDAYSIKPGDVIPTEIGQGLESCDIYLPILSNAALNSPWCNEEINAAIVLSNERGRNGRPRIISVLVEDCRNALPVFLKTRLYIQFAGRYEQALQELLSKGAERPIPNRPHPARELRATVNDIQQNRIEPIQPTDYAQAALHSATTIDEWEITVTDLTFVATLESLGRIEKAHGRFAVVFLEIANRGFSQATFVAYGKTQVRDASGQAYDENSLATALAQWKYKADIGANINPDEKAKVVAVFDVSVSSDYYTLAAGPLAKTNSGEVRLPTR